MRIFHKLKTAERFHMLNSTLRHTLGALRGHARTRYRCTHDWAGLGTLVVRNLRTDKQRGGDHLTGPPYIDGPPQRGDARLPGGPSVARSIGIAARAVARAPPRETSGIPGDIVSPWPTDVATDGTASPATRLVARTTAPSLPLSNTAQKPTNTESLPDMAKYGISLPTAADTMACCQGWKLCDGELEIGRAHV